MDDNNLATIALIVVLFALGLIIYLLPSIIAERRKHHALFGIAIVNIFFGWTLLAWVVCLIWAYSRTESQPQNQSSTSKPNKISKTIVFASIAIAIVLAVLSQSYTNKNNNRTDIIAYGGDQPFDIYYQQGYTKIALSDSGLPTYKQVTMFGINTCHAESVCVIWYFYNEEQAYQAARTIGDPTASESIVG